MVYNGTPIAVGIADGAAGGARFVSSIASPFGKYALAMTTRGVIWVAPYAFNGLGWLASNTYGGIKYVSSAIYNSLGSSQSLPDGSSLNQDSGWEIVNAYDKPDQGTELKDLSQPTKCPLGLDISTCSKVLAQ
ncbi:MAG: hypothetical protein NMK33_00235 [Candidatus Cardinium sp.]|uniref:hypothetical protein n=1 Tax=Cardinium endosymbiont of Dermatophagoides farinae TaxID=2597823 RepID=UPI00118379B9|nr:hypothetical protein [Cardinium endosymbiont of Dermatophagoides farinae]TSJ80965.1 hypothetical protein FPG78_02915 [Cardinium endosymbiont of Dermatophagoides farinae]UWW96991.1 MAG: hypothetical protein NMK33_00235 [Candidatus Cardinium sp.]